MVTKPDSLAFLEDRLNELYDKEEGLLNRMRLLYDEYLQLQEDKQLIEMMLMHQLNRKERIKNVFR